MRDQRRTYGELPTPYYEDEAVTIYHADRRDILPLLEPDSVDLVLTDPLVHPLIGDENLNSLADVMPHLDRLLHADRHAYVFAAPIHIGDVVGLLRDYWVVRNILVWDKGNIGTVGDLVAGYSANWESIIYTNKGRRALLGPRPRSIYRYDWSGTRDPVHPTVKPIGLLQWLIVKSAAEGEVIIDPFMGSGTTLRAAKDLRRKAIGIEIEESYCEIAARRMAQGVLL